MNSNRTRKSRVRQCRERPSTIHNPVGRGDAHWFQVSQGLLRTISASVYLAVAKHDPLMGLLPGPRPWHCHFGDKTRGHVAPKSQTQRLGRERAGVWCTWDQTCSAVTRPETNPCTPHQAAESRYWIERSTKSCRNRLRNHWLCKKTEAAIDTQCALIGSGPPLSPERDGTCPEVTSCPRDCSETEE